MGYRNRGTKANPIHQGIARKGLPAPLYKTWPTKREANDWADEIERRARGGGNLDFGALNKTTVKQLIEYYRDKVVAHQRGAKQATYKLDKLAKCDWANCKLSDDIHAALMKWRDHRLYTLEHKVGTVRRDFTTLRPVFNYAIKELKLPMMVNPAAMVRLPKGEETYRDFVWQDEHFEFWFNRLGFDPEKKPVAEIDFLPWALMIGRYTGMRLGEVCGIEMANIDLPNRVVLVGMTKNGKPLWSPQDSDAMEVLAKLMGYRAGHKMLIPVTNERMGDIFDNERRRAVRNGFAECKKHLFHSLRHTHTTTLVKMGFQAIDVAKIQGREGTKSLFRYYQPTALEQAQEMDRRKAAYAIKLAEDRKAIEFAAAEALAAKAGGNVVALRPATSVFKKVGAA